MLYMVKENFYTDESVISRVGEGINFAVGIAAFDSLKEPTLEPSYGEIVFVNSYWGHSENGEVYWTEKEIPSHTCSREELGLDQSENGSSFFPIKKENVIDVQTHQK